MVKEPVVKINKAQKFKQFWLRGWAREIWDGLHFIIKRLNPLVTDVVS